MPIYLIFDGGKDGTLWCYGSYQVLTGQDLEQSELANQVRYKRFPQCDTNNEAEYAALIEGLEWVTDNVPIDPEYCQLVIMGDSALVLNQVMFEWRVRAKNLVPFWERAVQLLSEFGEVITKKLDREEVKKYLWH